MNETLVPSVEECSLYKQCDTDTIMMTWQNLYIAFAIHVLLISVGAMQGHVSAHTHT